ncbi:beta-3-deoxy-D-manno-oct-2-ulosonic acid transferase [Rhodobacter sp. TJ_12]|uniref:capsular polysaccharide biosynthesis protein n=1 Tax=Rhodobacter sp. TJ_12 TaxID=2029399 RepID=UPI001CBEFB4C|nr:capsular polysaccharide biosynthesis protein [Rhodobacter sp. TJ_12]MBZ4023423.1 beta-3-deoxy-D-manno-oct-2-ulosonic acid transferase [Rhodobacter sp. TJ_12]
MSQALQGIAVGEGAPRRLYYYSLGFLREPRLGAILRARGHALALGLPGADDGVVVWGRSLIAARGEAVAARRDVPLVRLEDAFLRSVHPGRGRGAGGPLGLFIDPQGVHFDAATPSMLEQMLARAPLDDTALLDRARDGMARLKALDLSKYNDFDPDLEPPAPGYVLVIDQTAGDASVRHGGATPATFREMLAVAQIENPGARILIKTHPETRAGLRGGHYGPAHEDARTALYYAPVSPWKLLEGAVAVYTVSSQLGYEAILAGHKPRVFGQPFYAGWGLTVDENPVARRERRLTRAQMFAVSHILAPTWYDPCRARGCSFEAAVDQLEAEVRAYRADRFGHIASGMRLWKRRPLQAFFGRHKRLRFVDPPIKAAQVAQNTGRDLLIWAGRVPADFPAPALRVEDGFLRSRGLGADLVPPLSLVTDRRGIYYDPSQPSDLEALIAAAPPPGGSARAERLVAALCRAGLSKYNLGGGVPDLPKGRRILVPGQVEDDASIRLGAGPICTNLALLARVRAENPDAIVLFKPHPDVEAGLRPGAVAEAEALRHADLVLDKCDPIALIDQVEEVWTMTSLLGFEALLRGKKVTTTGAPFYAGWGLTRDLGAVPARRGGPVSLAQLAHAALIAYPRYFDPVSHRPCPPEVVVARLAHGPLPHPGAANRALAKLQGIFASYAGLWR